VPWQCILPVGWRRQRVDRAAVRIERIVLDRPTRSPRFRRPAGVGELRWRPGRRPVGEESSPPAPRTWSRRWARPPAAVPLHSYCMTRRPSSAREPLDLARASSPARSTDAALGSRKPCAGDRGGHRVPFFSTTGRGYPGVCAVARYHEAGSLGLRDPRLRREATATWRDLAPRAASYSAGRRGALRGTL